MSCRCLLCGLETDCHNPRVCDLCDLDNLTEEQAAILNLYYGGAWYQSKKEGIKNEETPSNRDTRI